MDSATGLSTRTETRGVLVPGSTGVIRVMENGSMMDHGTKRSCRDLAIGAAGG